MVARGNRSNRWDARPPTTPGGWAAELRQGEPAAVNTVRDRIRRILHYRRLGLGPQDREDLEQEIMTEIWQAVNRSSFDFSRGFWGFVEIVTARRCIDWLRRRRAHVPLMESLPDSRRPPTDKLIEEERAAIAAKAVKSLDPTCRAVMLMHFQERLSYKEIGRRIGKTEGAVRVQMHRCVRRAREILEGSGGQLPSGQERSGRDESQ